MCRFNRDYHGEIAFETLSCMGLQLAVQLASALIFKHTNETDDFDSVADFLFE